MPSGSNFLRSVRVRLLVIALLPMLVLLPLLLGGTLWRLEGKVDDLLVNKVNGDLIIADQYLARLLEMSGERIDAIARSVDLNDSLNSDNQIAFLEQERLRLGLDFLRIAPDTPAERRQPVIAAALDGHWHSAVDILESSALDALSPGLATQAEIPLMPTRAAAPTDRTKETRGMIIHSAAPLERPDGTRAALVGGVLLNRNLEFIDTINALVYREQSLPEGSQGTATLFLDDVRISTNVRLFENQRALGTRVSAEVRTLVLSNGQTWLDRAFVVDDWYISAYEPIVDSFGNRVGMLYVGFLETPFRQAKTASIVTLVSAFILITFLSVPLFLRWASHIFRPLEGMTKTIARVEAGDMTARNNPPNKGGEIAQVAGHLDDLLDQLQERDRELRDWAKSLETKVEDRTRDLRKANHRLERTTERLIMSEKLAAVGEITASVAHEINNPVAVIQGNLDLARSTLGDKADEVDEEFRLIDDQVYRIGVIVSKLLQFARPEEYSGSANLIMPSEVVRDCIVLTQHQIASAGITCNLSTDSVAKVRMSRTELQQVVVNLILNAVHAMSGGGLLSVATCDCEGGFMFSVTDTGTGISPDVRPRIFDPFYTTKQAQGTGLGLSISQRLVSRVGGHIAVESTVGKGSTFKVFLPVEK
ncbi:MULTISPECIES: sensor histidine kinase [Pacificibacter]|uniref:sensor histidine kinase n=1 Tax=Pacificibacter TaxID=1042323 RepID=UPI001C086E0B|nr:MULTISPECIES: cache domain-containing protein [Pacificibacter]MBU2937762.1 cache domain-containing protein [Pacificibacter marinus]MDO6616023.1 cache domain-containing protein [Pacificibacter sp. 1_MG-2023]